MKKTRSLIVMVALLVVLIAGYALWQLLGGFPTQSGETTASTPPPATELVKFNATDVNRVALANEKGQLVLEPTWVNPTPTPVPTPDPSATTAETGTTVTPSPAPTPMPILTWQLQGGGEEDLSQDLVNSLGNGLLTIAVTEDLGVKTAEELAQYGLNGEGTATAVYTLKDGSEVKVVLGNKVPATTTERYYALNQADQRVAVISGASDYLMMGKLDLLNKDVIGLAVEDLTYFSLKRQTEDFTITGQLQKAVQEGSADQWQMESPVVWKGNTSNIQNFLSEVVQITADEFFTADQDQVNRFGLNKPYYTITLGKGSEQKVLLISEQGSTDKAYAMIEGSSYVFSFNRSVLTQTGLPALDFYDKFAALVNITNVGTLTATIDNTAYVSRIFNPTSAEIEQAKADGKPEPKPAYTLNGEDANLLNDRSENLFTKYYQTLIGISVAGFDPDAKPLAEDPVYEVVYEMRNQDPDIKLDFIRRDERTLYVFKDGRYTGFYCAEADFTRSSNVDEPGVKLALQNLQEAIALQTSSSGTAESQATASGESQGTITGESQGTPSGESGATGTTVSNAG